MPKVTAELYEDDNTTKVCDLPFTWDGEWVEQLNDIGGGSLTAGNTRAEVAELTEGRVVRFLLDGEPVQATVIEESDSVTVAVDSADEVTTVRLSNILGQWADAKVRPINPIGVLPKSERVLFDWGHPALPTDSWSESVPDYAVFDMPDARVRGRPQVPEGWFDKRAWWHWSRALTFDDEHWVAPVGTSYTDVTFTAANNAEFVGVAAADNAAVVVLDGVTVATVDYDKTWRKSVFFKVPITAGTHTLRAEVTNDSVTASSTADNPAGFTFSGILKSGQFATLDDVVLRTGQTAGAWKWLDYPSTAPGFTIGHIIRLLMEAEQTLGGLPDWTRGFTDTHDSAGNEWPVIPSVPVTVGDGLLDTLIEFGRAHCDIGARSEGLVLDAWRWGERGNFWTDPADPVEWSRDNRRLIRLQHRSRR